MSGLFVTLDGPGGVGKSTVTAELHDLLTAQGYPVLATTEPSRTPLGQLLRENTDRYQGHSLAHLIAGDRIDHLASTVGPAVSRGTVVVCDRYIASSLVLQRMDGMLPEEIWDINQPLGKPSLSVFLTADQAVIEARLKDRGPAHSRFEEMVGSTALELRYYAEAVTFLRAKGFASVVLDCTQLTPSQVAARIVSEIDRTHPLEGRVHA